MPLKWTHGHNPYIETYFARLRIGPNAPPAQIAQQARQLKQLLASQPIEVGGLILDEYALSEAAAKLMNSPPALAQELLLVHALPREEGGKIKRVYDIGIDLGTTYSVIAVKGQVRLVDGYPQGTHLPECDVTIIPTPEGDPTFPSVFWIDPDEPSHVLVGLEAKLTALNGETPIEFSKRSIGTTERLRIRDREFTAKEVATHLLRYFKSCAEQAMGQPVHRAVITHPAYFDRSQVQETREAAEAAGFDMSLPEQMLMEPSAAALAYTAGIEKDPLLIMTYDLGGGTFDVTVLERSQGVITIRAFDGDHLLGGYNFDRALAEWILAKVREKGRVIPYNDDNPEDRNRRARLLQLAESVKVKLSEARGPRVPVDVRAPDILVDDHGRPVPVLEKITREQYAELIREDLDRTIACCRSALAKAGVEASQLDELLLVGGSTYGQWVQEAVKNAFGLEAQPYNPDQCVAAGAALRAGELPAVASGEGIEAVIDVPPRSALPTINVPGHLRIPEGAASTSALSELLLYLDTPSVGTLDAVPDENGEFLFPDIALQDGEPSEFTLKVTDEQGLTLLTKSFTVEYAPESAGATEIYTVLPKPIYIRTTDGMKPLAEEGAVLPARCEITCRKVLDDSALDIEVFQGDERISVIEVTTEEAAGSEVVITVEITEKNEMKGIVTVTGRTGAVATQRSFQMTFPPTPVPDLADLRAEYDEVEAERQQLEALSDDPEQRLLLASKGRKITRKLERLFAEQAPDRQEIHVALKSLSTLVHPPAEDMNPPRAQFRRMFEYGQDMFDSLGSDPQVQPLRQALKRIETDGDDAYTTKNHKKWALANDDLAKLVARLDRICNPSQSSNSDELPDTITLKDQARQRVDGERTYVQGRHEDLRSHPRYAFAIKARLDALEPILVQMEKAIDKVADGTEPRQALAQLQQATRQCPEVHKTAAEADQTIFHVSRTASSQDDTRSSHGEREESWGQIKDKRRIAQARSFVDQAVELIKGDREDEALGVLEQAEALAPDLGFIYFLRAQCYLMLGHVEAAQADLVSFARVDDSYEAKQACARLQERVDHLGQQVAKFGSEGLKLRAQAVTAANAKRFRQAADLLQQVLAQCPPSGKPEIQKELASVLIYGAITAVNTAMEDPLETPSAKLAACQQALASLREAVKLDPSNEQTRKPLADLQELMSRSDLATAGASGFYWLATPQSVPSIPSHSSPIRAPTPHVGSTSQLRAGKAVAPCAAVDRVHFSVTSPPMVMPGSTCVIDVWAFLPAQRARVLDMAREEAGVEGVRIKSKGPVRVERGTVLTVRLWAQDLDVAPIEDTILWEGEVGNASFSVTAGQDIEIGGKSGVARVLVNGFEIARLAFVVQIGPTRSGSQVMHHTETRMRSAFASYASPDENTVLVCIQALQKAVPGISVFFARKDLQSGEKWQDRLLDEIRTRDVLYLFWSEAASRSEWVEWEWRHALELRGRDFINPWPLAGAERVPPPEELAKDLHFADWQLAYMNRGDQPGSN